MSIRVVCLGANLESKVALECLLEDGANVVGLITLPPGADGGVSDYCDLHDYAASHGVQVIDTLDVNSDSTVSALVALEADYLFVLGWSQLLRAGVLRSVSKFVVGSHPTPLPLRRGRAPVPWTIIEGLNSSAVTLFRMTEKIDDGPILLQSRFEIGEDAYAMDVYLKVAETLASSFLELYNRLNSNEIICQPVADSVASYRGKRTPQDGFLDFSLSNLSLVRLVRAVSKPYPGAYFFYRDQQIVVWACDRYEGPERVGINGQILAKEGNALIVRVSDGCLKLWDFEVGGRRTSMSEFTIGDVLNHRLHDEVFMLRRRVAELERLVGGLLGKLDA